MSYEFPGVKQLVQDALTNIKSGDPKPTKRVQEELRALTLQHLPDQFNADGEVIIVEVDDDLALIHREENGLLHILSTTEDAGNDPIDWYNNAIGEKAKITYDPLNGVVTGEQLSPIAHGVTGQLVEIGPAFENNQITSRYNF